MSTPTVPADTFNTTDLADAVRRQADAARASARERIAATVKAYAERCYLCHAPALERCLKGSGPQRRPWDDPHRGRNGYDLPRIH